eukprot:TRINITY_DN62144_c0_g1_i1.p1 TRINITY_DN62144_c0_g1~~TRINITY_DN62144_c0_g1_i1.p1  ORF type:complete len:340 (+),score=-32.17 TRINITY_DN62144_c0_g1_i1:2-1021(+)
MKKKNKDTSNKKRTFHKKDDFIAKGQKKGKFLKERKEEREEEESDYPKKDFTDKKVYKRKKDGEEGKGKSFSKGKVAKAPVYDQEKLQKLAAKTQKSKSEQSGNTETRLNKFIANAGVCSRREADKLIENGDIKVNGKVVLEMGYKVKPGDEVKYKGKVLQKENLIYLLLNKPKDHITTVHDPEGRKTVMNLVRKATDERIYPVGRLDRQTTGLLLMTNDGDLAQKLAHPSGKVKKVYQVVLDKPLTEEDFEAIQNGLTLEDGEVKVDKIAVITPDATIIGIEIHIGKNRIVRRIFEHLGYDVVGLDRTIYAGLTKKDLPRGKWRFLKEKELINLKYFL